MSDSGWFKRISTSTSSTWRSLGLASPTSAQGDAQEEDRRVYRSLSEPSRAVSQMQSPAHDASVNASSASSQRYNDDRRPRELQPVDDSSHRSADDVHSRHQNTSHSRGQPHHTRQHHAGNVGRGNSIFTRRPSQQPLWLPPPPPPQLSPNSSAGFPDSIFYCEDFMTGAGMVILQPSTARVVVVYDKTTKAWFLPKGRKDIGESLEQTALREAYEESGYRADFLPLPIRTNAPIPPEARALGPQLNTEPIYITTCQWRSRRRFQDSVSYGGEYLTFWYVGQIAHDAVREENTGMEDEQGYVSHLVDIQTALNYLQGSFECIVVDKAFTLWRDHAAIDAQYNPSRERGQQGVKEEQLRSRAVAIESTEGMNTGGSRSGTRNSNQQPRFTVG